MRVLKFQALWTIGVVLLAVGPAAANVLVNPGFETDAVLDAAPVAGATGWTPGGNMNTASANGDPVLSGIGSLQLVGGGGFGVPVAFQTFPASPGEIWNFEGYMLTESALPADATFGLLKIVWSDGTNDLPPGPINIGQPGPPANPGVEGLPFLNSGSSVNDWIFTQAQGVAPTGTTQVNFFAILVDQSAATIYFDDLSATRIPEPTSLVLFGLATILGGSLLQRRRGRKA